MSAFQIVLPASIGAGGAVFLLAEPIATGIFDSVDLIPVLRIFAVALPFPAVTRLALGAIQGAQRTLPKVYVENLGTPLLRLAFVIAAIGVGARAIGVAWAYALARILSALAALYFLYRHTVLSSWGEYVPLRKELLVFSTPLLISSMMGRILADLDTYLLGYFVDLGTVGVYNVIYPIVTSTGFVLAVFG